MSRDADPPASAPPLLEARGLRLVEDFAASDAAGRRPAWAASLSGAARVEGQRVCCFGKAAALVDAMVRGHRLEAGEILCWGRPVSELLREGVAGFAPMELPATPSAKLEKTLTLGARICGFGKKDVRVALERCHLAGHAGSRLRDLDPVGRRLAALAHALCGNPPLVIVQDPYLELEDADAEIVQQVLEDELSARSWIVSVTGHEPFGRRLASRASQCLFAAGGELVGPVPAEELRHAGYWLVLSEPTDALHSALLAAGLQTTETSRSNVLLVHGSSGLAILKAARDCQVRVLELEPANF